MIYPKFLKKGDTVGICAPSSGISEKDFTEFELSLSHLQREGYCIKETKNVRTGLYESSPPEIRGAELNSLLRDGDINGVICASGGDFLLSMLPYVDYEAVRENPKWVQGYSDPTSLLYSITTKLDVATIYGVNAGGFWMEELHPSLADGLKILKGDIPVQNSFEYYERDRSGRNGGYNLTEKVEWLCPNGEFTAKGRLLGGCLDCITDLAGIKFDGTGDFIERYKDDGVIWYFDIFSLRSEQVYLTLFKLKTMGYFDTARAFIFGRVCFPNTYVELSYIDAARKILGDVPIVFDADIGHVPPKFTVINGAVGEITCKNGGGSLKMELV